MTPVMERCQCSWPVAECIEHSPPRAQVDDQDGLAQPTRAAYILVAITGACVALDIVVVVGVVKAIEWLLGPIG
jgi:hypothetical protein